MCSLMRLGVAFALLSVITGPAYAQTDAAENRWQFTATIYGWLAGIDGKVATFGAPEADASTSLDELVERLDGAFMGIVEARRGRFLVAGDILWARLSVDYENDGFLYDVEQSGIMLGANYAF